MFYRRSVIVGDDTMHVGLQKAEMAHCGDERPRAGHPRQPVTRLVSVPSAGGLPLL